MAVVEFLEPLEARSAFRRLAYSMFKGCPLFLEWAPAAAFRDVVDSEDVQKRRKARIDAAAASAATAAATAADVGEEEVVRSDDEDEEVENAIDSRIAAITSRKSTATSTATPTKNANISSSLKPRVVEIPDTGDDDVNDPDAMPVATLFVKNLNFSTTEEVLRSCVEAAMGAGGDGNSSIAVRSIRIARKPDAKRPGQPPLSMGFGFIEFQRKDDAIKAVKALQGVELEGHKLQFKFSNAAAKSGSAMTGKRSRSAASANSVGEEVKALGTKLIIRNIPFEATKKDIKQLFS